MDLKEVYDDLISSDILLLPSASNGSSIIPSVAHLLAARAQSVSQTKPPMSTRPTNVSTTIGIHRTRDGRRFVCHNNNILSSKQSSCQLYFNIHVNPWHDTDNFPYKYLTQILPRDVRECVMQHNALHGAEKRDYNKTQDIQRKISSPPQATGHSATTLDSSHLPLDTKTDSDNPFASDSPITTSETPVQDQDKIVETEYFDVPFYSSQRKYGVHPYYGPFS